MLTVKYAARYALPACSSAITTVPIAAALSKATGPGLAPVSQCQDAGTGWSSSTESSTILSGHGAARLIVVSMSIVAVTITSHAR